MQKYFHPLKLFFLLRNFVHLSLKKHIEPFFALSFCSFLNKVFENGHFLPILTIIFYIFAHSNPCYAENTSDKIHQEKKFFEEQIALPNVWYYLEHGAEYMLFKKARSHLQRDEENSDNINTSKTQSNFIKIHCLKFNPKEFHFSLHCAAEQKAHAKTLENWNKEIPLLSAINASMFLKDSLTSNGYMKNGDYFNNKKIASRLGAFFLSSPKKTSLHPNDPPLPSATILYKEEDLQRFSKNKNINLQDILDAYDIVIQNFKLIEFDYSTTTQNQDHQWKSEARHPILALAEDREGNILFLFSPLPLRVQTFIDSIRNTPKLSIIRALYLEGGAHTAMSLCTADFSKYWYGQNDFISLFTGRIPLPNIIGVQKKEQENVLTNK